ncbi:hypothetical protein JVU11DRAFT_835 [Chiua virens]|nr:hypothetical protein JVU11DRAFT_835 [Chiua virens]
MPRESTDRRKSSFGARRGPPRQHIPFRADDLARGKKTGLAVAYCREELRRVRAL